MIFLRRWGAQVLFLMMMGICAAWVYQAKVVADLTAFMPSMPNARQQLLVDQLRDGVVGRLILVGIEGGRAEDRADLSIRLAKVLRQHPAIIGIQNGDVETTDRDRAYFFGHRYLLSPQVHADRFSVEGLREAIGTSIEALSGHAGLMLKALLPIDPTGETLRLIQQFSGEGQPRSAHGAWASGDGQRAILLVQSRIQGSDTEAQAQLLDEIRRRFGEIAGATADTRLVMTGTSVFSVQSRHLIESEVRLLASLSLLLVTTLLLFVYRSLTLLVLGLIPVLAGALVGIAAVSLVFGSIHGITLGFGTTLIGEAVDYSIYLFIQRQLQGHSDSFWRTIRLGVLTSVVGFGVLMVSGFPGLSQLGVYSTAGLIAAALVTRYVLPGLIPSKAHLHDVTPYGAGLVRILPWLKRGRRPVLLLALLALSVVGLHSGQVWNRQLSALSPVSKADMALDQSLRADLAAPDMRYLVTFTAPDEESALQNAEAVALALEPLVQSGVLAGYHSPAQVWPSQRAQTLRRAALPSSEVLVSRLREALKDQPLRPHKLQGFVDDLETARTGPLLTRADLAGTSAAMLVDSLLVKREQDYLVLMPLQAPASGQLPPGEIDLAQVDAALLSAKLGGVTSIDILTETASIFDSYLREALWLTGVGAAMVLALLFGALRDPVRVLRLMLPLGCAVVAVTAGLLLLGIQLTILHLVGLLLVVAVGSNYALFFDSGARSHDVGELHRTWVSLIVANLTTVGGFVILGFSEVPILSALGVTVGAGAFLSLLFSAVLTPQVGGPGAYEVENARLA